MIADFSLTLSWSQARLEHLVQEKMAIRPDIVDEDVIEDQIYVLPEKSWQVSIFQQKEVYRVAMYLKEIYFSFQKGKLKFSIN